MGQSLKTKSGVECIDVNDYLLEMFIAVGYDQLLEEADTDTLPKVNFKRVNKDLTDIQKSIMVCFLFLHSLNTHQSGIVMCDCIIYITSISRGSIVK